MGKHTPYFELRDNLTEPGCVICRLALKSVQQHIGSLVYEYANKPPTHKKVRQARGFCNVHAWQLSQQRGAVTDLAILGRTALKSSLEVLQRYDPGNPEGASSGAMAQLRAIWKAGAASPGIAGVAQALEPAAPCSICQIRDESEVKSLETLFKYLDDPEIVHGFEQAGGLCWPHIRLALRQSAGKAQIQRLLTMQRVAGERLLAELDEFIRKQDYRFQDEAMGPEADAWRRAIAQFAGLQGVW